MPGKTFCEPESQMQSFEGQNLLVPSLFFGGGSKTLFDYLHLVNNFVVGEKLYKPFGGIALLCPTAVICHSGEPLKTPGVLGATS